MSLTAKGFKSFGRKTTFDMSHDVTSIVGPNGSGKSNVVDALSWVMGEQGPTNLRSSKMEDVIFSGSESAPPLGRAEVTLNFQNASGALKKPFSEISLSRVVYRNGLSEYSINGEKCRLLDIQELLSDTSLGREMHSIVGQGQLERVLRATPLDRRAFIEEAAGVLKYRRRREKTQRKIEAMQANLVRLQDLIAEVKRNLRPLGRQAETAQQAKEIAAGLREAKSKLFAVQVLSLRVKMDQCTRDESEKKSDASLAQSQLDTSREALLAVEAELNTALPDSARKRLFTLESMETALRSLGNVATQRISLNESGPTLFASEELRRVEAELLERTKSQQLLNAGLDSALTALSHASQVKDEALSALKEFDANVETLLKEAEAARAERAKIDGKRKALEDFIEAGNKALIAKTRELETVKTELAKLQSRKRESEEISSNASADHRQEYELSLKEEEESRVALDQARDGLYELEKKRDYLAASHAALGQILENPDGGANLLRVKFPGVDQLLAESIRVQPGYEKALAAALGSLANSVTVRDFETAVSALKHLRENNLGRVELVISRKSATSPSPNNSDHTSLESVVEVPDELKTFLSNFQVVKDLREAAALVRDARDEDLVVVTLDGDYISKRLVKGGGGAEVSKVELISERAQISEQLGKLSKQIDKAKSSLEAMKTRQSELSRKVASRRAELQEHDAESARNAEAQGMLIARLESAQAERGRLESSLAQLRAKLENDITLLADLNSEFDPENQVSFYIDEAKRLQLAEALEDARQAETRAQIELGTVREQLAATDREQAALHERLESTKKELADLAEKAKLQGAETVKAKWVVKASGLILPVVERLIEASKSEMRDLEASRQQMVARVTELRAQINHLETRLFELNRSLQEAEMKKFELNLQQKSINDKILDELSITHEELLQETTLPKENDETIQEELRKAIRASEARLAQLGAFNPLALEEYAALEERHRYLTEQLAELNNARADLKRIMKDLDEKMNNSFLSAFEDTKKAFEDIFPMLFPGGMGTISLTKSEDDGEDGVEVSVKPAGKRIERLSLLSGGERSLAALALLIAIFKARPSPFYVLDEVEAALDDSNLDRLLRVLETLRGTSQLIIVTHQKKTMGIADALYGVSMGADGVTKVMSQTLEKAS